MKAWFAEFRAPFVYKGNGDTSYAEPYAEKDGDTVSLHFLRIAGGVTESLVSRTVDFIRWSAPVPSGRKNGGRCVIEGYDGTRHRIFAREGALWTETEGCMAKRISLDTEYLAPGAALSSPSAVSCDGFSFLFYQADDSIMLAATADGENFISFARDNATYEDHGIVYDGDYYKPLPFGEYISREELPSGPDVFDVRDFGAVPDTAFISTPAFIAAFAAAERNGGGTVLVTGGYYCSASIAIPSNTTLFIDRDSAICASKDLSRYRNMFIGSIGGENIAIRGGGKIMCNGEYFVYLPKYRPRLKPLDYIRLPPVLYDRMGYPVDSVRYAYRSRIRYAIDIYEEGLPAIKRPMNNVWIRGCHNVTVENIIIEDAYEWSLNIEASENVTVRNAVINDNRHVANTDGIDVTSSRNVSIEHCFISCADDGICLKAPLSNDHDGLHAEGVDGTMGPTENVRVKDCTVMTVMNAFKIGTGTFHDIRNVRVEGCRFMLPDIYPGSVSGISIECVDGGNVSDIRISNIEMYRICCPVFICQNMRNCNGLRTAEDGADRIYGGQLENVTIENVHAESVEVPSIITGFETELDGKHIERNVRNITISGYFARYADDAEKLDIKDKVHESVREYPESNSFGDVPAYGFYIRHGENVSLENIEVVPRTMNTRECIVREKA